jgi:tetratricopeptide (TPR) repeat protein
MSVTANLPSTNPLPAEPGSRWLFGPIPDLLLGCGVGYAIVLALLCVFGAEVRQGLAPGFLPFLTVLIGAPHYGATLLRVYERREDRRAYALFSVWATLLLAALFVVSTRSVWLGSLVLTVYITWSPWHYTGQNYGLAVMFLRRRGVALDATTKRYLYSSFLLSYAATFLAIHSQAPGANYTPPLYIADSYRVISLGIPNTIGGPLFYGALAAYCVTLLIAVARLLRRASLGAIAPALLLAITQALWFSIPVAMRRFGLLSSLEPFAPQYAGWYFFWAALGHSIQYVWVTSYFARNTTRFPGLPAYLAKALFAGTAIWGLPALLFAPGLLGRIPYDAGLGALIAAVVNLHHFVLDGAIWKLRDGRIARILVRSERAAAPLPIGEPRRRWLAPALLGIGALSCATMVLAEFETEFGLRRAYARVDVPRMRSALARLDWIGRDSANNHLSFGRLLAAQGEPGGAIREYQQSVNLYPTADAWVSLGDLLDEKGLIPQALEAFENAIELAPDSAPIAYRGAAIAAKANDPERARALLERAVAIDPTRKLYQLALENLRDRAPAPAPKSTATQ